MLPPVTVYKSQTGNLYRTWGDGHMVGAEIAANPSGWFGMFEYECFIFNVFVPWLSRHFPKE